MVGKKVLDDVETTLSEKMMTRTFNEFFMAKFDHKVLVKRDVARGELFDSSTHQRIMTAATTNNFPCFHNLVIPSVVFHSCLMNP